MFARRAATQCPACAVPLLPQPPRRLRLRPPQQQRPRARRTTTTTTTTTAQRGLHSVPRASVPPERRSHRWWRHLTTTAVWSAPATSSGLVAGTSPAVAAAAGTAAAATLLAPFVEDLDGIAPCFCIHGSQVEILDTPAAFYERLKAMIRGAERRIFLSTLYIGKSETELLATLQETLRAKPHVRLHILTDALRGTREAPAPSCAALLAPLVAEFGAARVDVRMYHTPNLTGLRRRLVPRRINEGWGLQHMKLYGVDDAILLSGANLSADYFSDRQDRYHVFAAPALADFYWRLHRAVASLSFAVAPAPPPAAGTPDPGFVLTWPATNAAPSPLEAPGAFVAGATAVLRGLLAPPPGGRAVDDAGGRAADTRVYALAQMTQLLRPDASTEQPALAAVLRTLAAPAYAGAAWTFTAGYFNPAPFLSDLLLAAARTGATTGTVITAAPQANGFYRSAGVSGLLPDAYTFLAARFLRAATQEAAGRIALREWRRGTVGTPGGWSYHAKGLWVALPGAAGAAGPALTLVGSSNYTQRSYALDLEANALVVTANADLQRRLGAEQARLQAHAAPTTADDFARPERRVRAHVRLAMWLVRVLGGAL